MQGLIYMIEHHPDQYPDLRVALEKIVEMSERGMYVQRAEIDKDAYICISNAKSITPSHE